MLKRVKIQGSGIIYLQQFQGFKDGYGLTIYHNVLYNGTGHTLEEA